MSGLYDPVPLAMDDALQVAVGNALWQDWHDPMMGPYQAAGTVLAALLEPRNRSALVVWLLDNEILHPEEIIEVES